MIWKPISGQIHLMSGLEQVQLNFLSLLIDYENENSQVLSASSFRNANPDDGRNGFKGMQNTF